MEKRSKSSQIRTQTDHIWRETINQYFFLHEKIQLCQHDMAALDEKYIGKIII